MSKLNYRIDADVRIEIIKGGFLLTYPKITSHMETDKEGISIQFNDVVTEQELFTSVTKMKRKISDVVEEFSTIINEQQ